MYDELIKALHEGAEFLECSTPGIKNSFAKMCHNAADAIEELSRAQEQWIEQERNALLKSIPRWIPVTERLPEAGADVLVMFPNNMAVASRDMGEWVVNSGDGWCTDVNLSDDEKEPTHWMPLPTPPKEE